MVSSVCNSKTISIDRASAANAYLSICHAELGDVLAFEEFFKLLGILLSGETVEGILNEVPERKVPLKSFCKLFEALECSTLQYLVHRHAIEHTLS
jgi:hypothetical protein